MAEKFRSYMGPGDKDLPRANEVQGYQPVSRIGEVVMNAFVDAYEHQVLKGGSQNDANDEVPAFYEFAAARFKPPSFHVFRAATHTASLFADGPRSSRAC